MPNVVMDTAIALVTVLGIIAVASIIFKNNGAYIAPFVMIAGVLAHLFLGLGPGVRQVVEGMFGYFDYVMAALCGMIFMTVLYENGTLEFLFKKITGKKRNPVIQSFLLLLFVMLPGMMTGTAVASTALVGGMVGRFLIKNGAGKAKAAGFAAAGSMLGMLCPPLSLPTMMFSTSYSYMGVLGAYVGWVIVMLIVTVPAFLIFGLASSKLGNFEPEAAKIMKGKGKSSSVNSSNDGNALSVIPLVIACVLLLMNEFFPQAPYLGYPLIFMICTVLAVFLPAKKFGVSALPKALVSAVRTIAPTAAVIFVSGSAMEIFASTGVSGTLGLYLGRTDASIVAIGAMAIIVITGCIFGGAFAIPVGTLGVYAAMSSFVATGQAKIVGMAAALAVALAFPLAKGALDPLKKNLEMEEGPGSSLKIIAASVIPIAVVLITGAVVVLFSQNVGTLRLPFNS